MDIWIIEQSSGSWDDLVTNNVIAFESKVDAKKWIAKNNALLPEKFTKDKEDANEYRSRYETILEKYELLEWDDTNPNFRKWRDELDELDREWDNQDKVKDFIILHPYRLGKKIELKLKS